MSPKEAQQDEESDPHERFSLFFTAEDFPFGPPGDLHLPRRDTGTTIHHIGGSSRRSVSGSPSSHLSIGVRSLRNGNAAIPAEQVAADQPLGRS